VLKIFAGSLRFSKAIQLLSAKARSIIGVIFMKNLCFVFFGLLPFSTFAQWRQEPVATPSTEARKTKPAISTSAQRTQALTLPFFEDFSTYAGKPDTARWQPGGGTRISNLTAVQPPSKGVVQLDGARFSGAAYNAGTQLASGDADTLTSKALDLSLFQPKDSVYLSFWYQPQGLVEPPNAGEGDSLVVEFLSADNTWKRVWRQGGSEIKPFRQVLVGLKSQAYFHQNFRFRFHSLGRLSGGYDAWEVDYIYLNKNRSTQDTAIKDLAATAQPTNLFRRYTAMTVRQFGAGKNQAFASNITAFLNNLNNNFNVPKLNFILKNDKTGEVYDEQNTVPERIESFERKKYTISPKTDKVPIPAAPLTLRCTFNFITLDRNDLIPPIDFRQNDTISGVTVINDELAYDDGSAEFGGGINQRLGKVAVQFYAPAEEVLTAVRIYQPQLGRSLAGQTFVLYIWKKLDNRPESVLYQQSIGIDTLFNRFNTYRLNKLLAVKDTFYIGWQQTTNTEQFNVGIDKNNDAGRYIFYNLGGNATPWQADTAAIQPLEGSFMMRAVFGKDTLTATESWEPDDFRLYPNPAEHEIFWSGAEVEEVQLLDLTGRLVLEKKIIYPDNRFSLETLPAGLYVARFRSGKKQFSRKVILVH
jgi:hypothetical protein